MNARAIAATVVALTSCAQRTPPIVVVDPSSGQQLAFSIENDASSANFGGDYYSPQTGALHIEQRAQRVFGSYRNVHDECTVAGRVEGRTFGRRAELEWSESEICAGGSAAWLDGHAELVLDRGPGDGQAVRLFGRRALRVREQVTHHGQITHFERLEPATPWLAIRLTQPATLPPQGGGQVGPLSAASPEQLATRLAVVSRALARVDTLAHAPDRPDLLRAHRRAGLALDQGNEALALWQRGDPRRWLQVEYCVAQATSEVARELSALNLVVPGGLLNVAPSPAPATWSDASCPR